MANDIDTLLAQLRDSAKRTALITHDDYSDERLAQIIVDNAKIAASMTPNAQNLSEMAKLTGEAQACSEILKNRQEKKNKEQERQKRILQKKRDWEEKLEARKDEAILNLKYAASPNGQLVAAILEDEDGKTEEELYGWCDELSSLEEKDFHAMLEGLVSEGILVKYSDDDKYYLRVICDESMQWNRESAVRLYKSLTGNQRIAEKFYESLKHSPHVSTRYFASRFYQDDKSRFFKGEYIFKNLYFAITETLEANKNMPVCEKDIAEDISDRHPAAAFMRDNGIITVAFTEKDADGYDEKYYLWGIIGERGRF
ncbi:MAG: hypothetical protein IJG50_09365 [Clostridia bacterium]|nr:hypothetical protein [Clostridia bacterium]